MQLFTFCLFSMVSLCAATELKHFFFHKGKAVEKLVLFMSEKPVFKFTEQTVQFDSCTISAKQRAELERKIAPVAQLFTLSFSSDSLVFIKQKIPVSFALQEISSDRFGPGIMLIASHVKLPIKNNKNGLIFIDPGHGGTDTGAKTAQGVYEKDISLAVSKILMQKLSKRGYSVETSRVGDAKIELDERTIKANLLEADLFISLHVDSCNRKDKAGISIRIPCELSFLAQESQASFQHSEKKRLLASTHFAELLNERLLKEKDFFNAKQIRRISDPFQVLLGAEMPAVLIEMGFLSNKEEAEQLQNPLYQEKLAACIADTIDSYYKSNKINKRYEQRRRYDTRSS